MRVVIALIATCLAIFGAGVSFASGDKAAGFWALAAALGAARPLLEGKS